MQSLQSTTKLVSTPAKPASAPKPARFVKAPVAPHMPLVPAFASTAARLLRLPHASPMSFPTPRGNASSELQQPAFVRPDVPPLGSSDTDAEGAALPQGPSSVWPRRQQPLPAVLANNIVDKPGSMANEKVHFRSALEQVSYQTAKVAMGSSDEDRSLKGKLFGRRK